MRCTVCARQERAPNFPFIQASSPGAGDRPTLGGAGGWLLRNLVGSEVGLTSGAPAANRPRPADIAGTGQSSETPGAVPSIALPSSEPPRGGWWRSAGPPPAPG